MDEKTEAFLRRAPALRKRDVEDINALFESYIFRRRSTGEIWTSCCRRHATLPAEAEIWERKHVREPRGYWKSEPGHGETPCPLCGRMGTVKDLRYTGRRENLYSERRIALLRWDGRALWAECAEAKKDYTDADALTDPPAVRQRALYRFGPEAVESIFRGWWRDDYGALRHEAYADFNKKTVEEPFPYSFDEGLGYAVVGADAVAKSPARYCRAEDWIGQHACVIKFLHLAHVYPRKVEMLMKAGMAETVWDLARRGVKHAAVLDWKAADDRTAWKVPPQILREFLKRSNDIGLLEMWQRLNRTEKVSLAETEAAYPALSGHPKALALARRRGVAPMRLYRYLERQGNPQALFTAWEDYVRLGERQGMALHRSDVLLPADLGAAHDAVVAEQNRLLEIERKRREAERRAQEAMERELRDKAYAERKKVLERKYAWTDGTYQIVVPDSEEAIREEGRVLQHCVGGYAQRHAEGKTVILFMRKVRAPETPWLTIEMWGTQLHQIHGFRNEGAYTSKRIAPDPREKYRAFLDPWLAWVAAGSRRKKDGTPAVPKRRKEKVA